GIEHNEALCVGEDNRHMATPDAVGPEGIAEFKTATQPLERAVRTYSDQLQWQMHVLHTERVLFVVEDRHTLQREWTWVHRDEGRIRVLVEHADRFIASSRNARRSAKRSTPKRECAARTLVRLDPRVELRGRDHGLAVLLGLARLPGLRAGLGD